MSMLIGAASALSVAANSDSADQINPTYQNIGKGRLMVVAKASATGLKCTCKVNGVLLIPNLAIPFTGTAGTISVKDNVMLDQAINNGGRVELFFTNTTGGALTVDHQIYFG